MKRRTREAAGSSVETSDDGVVDLRTPLIDPVGTLAGFLAMSYSTQDPLAVEVSVRSLADAVVLSRTLLRADIERAMDTVVRMRDVSVAPASLDRLRFVFYEGRAIVEACAPVSDVRGFVRSTEKLVPHARETSAVDRLIRLELLSKAGFPEASTRE